MRWLKGTDTFFIDWFHSWFGEVNLTWTSSLFSPLTPTWKWLFLVTLENVPNPENELRGMLEGYEDNVLLIKQFV